VKHQEKKMITQEKDTVDPQLRQQFDALSVNYNEVFQQWHPNNHIIRKNQPNTIGNEVSSVGEWSCTLQSENGPVQISAALTLQGLVFVRAMFCQIRMSSFNLTPLPAATA